MLSTGSNPVGPTKRAIKNISAGQVSHHSLLKQNEFTESVEALDGEIASWMVGDVRVSWRSCPHGLLYYLLNQELLDGFMGT